MLTTFGSNTILQMSTELSSVDVDDPVNPRIATLLENDRRRAALSILAEETGPVPESALARAVAIEMAVEESAQVDETALRSVRIALHHCDLPKLEAHGLVDHDLDERVATVTERGRDLASQVWDDDAQNALAINGGREWMAILVSLATLEAPVRLQTLAEALVDDHGAWENPESAATRLHHVDLPGLDDSGALSYDATEKQVQIL